MGGQIEISGPDFKNGVKVDSLKSGEKILGHVGKDPILLIKEGEQFFALGAACSHYGANLNDGIVVDGTIRCPWHHACFDIKTGDAKKAPALNPIQSWCTEIKNGMVYVTAKNEFTKPKPVGSNKDKFVIIGSGAAGHAAAEMLRRQGFQGQIQIFSEDTDVPYDRPNLSKDYLAGSAPEEWMSLRDTDFYQEQKIDLHLNCKVIGLDAKKKAITLASGDKVQFDKCLIATGGTPFVPKIEGIEKPQVRFLRSFSDCRTLISSLKGKKEVVIIGSGFIGLEAASALKTTGLSVTIVAPNEYPLSHVFGNEVGVFLKSVHEKNGIRFHLKSTIEKIDKDAVVLNGGLRLPADVVLVATGIVPNTKLAENAGIKCDNGILVNSYLETNLPDVFATGDLARWPDPYSGKEIRVEHWVVAQRQGQVAAKNMLGQKIKYQEVPFFWSQQFDVMMAYVGHASSQAKCEIKGSLEDRNCVITYREGSQIAAALTIGQDLESLRIEHEMEKNS